MNSDIEAYIANLIAKDADWTTNVAIAQYIDSHVFGSIVTIVAVVAIYIAFLLIEFIFLRHNDLTKDKSVMNVVYLFDAIAFLVFAMPVLVSAYDAFSWVTYPDAKLLAMVIN